MACQPTAVYEPTFLKCRRWSDACPGSVGWLLICSLALMATSEWYMCIAIALWARQGFLICSAISQGSPQCLCCVWWMVVSLHSLDWWLALLIKSVA